MKTKGYQKNSVLSRTLIAVLGVWIFVAVRKSHRISRNAQLLQDSIEESQSPKSIDSSFKLTAAKDHGTFSHGIPTTLKPKSPVGLARDFSDPRPFGGQNASLGLSGSHNRLMIIPEYKLLFCYVEKVGCSMFNQLFRMLRMYHPEQTSNEREWLAASHFGRANPKHFNMTHRDLQDLVNNEEWTKAIFYRDPADRFLSGFKSKCGGSDADGKRSCGHAFGTFLDDKGKKQPLLDGGVPSFHQSIEMTHNNTKHVFKNMHFKPAAKFCGGLDRSIDRYNFVQKLDKTTVGGHIRTLFDHVGVDRKLTEGLIERVVKTGGILHPFDKKYVKNTWGLMMKGNISDSHNTAKHKLSSKDYFQSEELLKKLQNIYQSDYDVFQLEPQRFEELK